MGSVSKPAGSMVTDRELIELMLRAPPSALAGSPALNPLFRRLVEKQPAAEDRERLLAAASSAAPAGPWNTPPCKPPCMLRASELWTPPNELLDAASLVGRGRQRIGIPVAALARRVDLDACTVAEGLNHAELMISLPLDESGSGLADWHPIFQLAAALGTPSDEVRARAMEGYSQSEIWEWVRLPLDACSDALLRWLTGDFMRQDQFTGVGVFCSLVFSPEAFNVAAGHVLSDLHNLDAGAFRSLLAVLSNYDRSSGLARENPVRKLVQELVRHAVEVTGDSIDAAAGLDVLFVGGHRNSALPTSVDLALATTVATSVAAGRTGWRNPMLRPAMLEAALHGAPGCRRAALMLAVE